ncbi:MAG: ABC-type antimicrobial peptide transport system, permease component [Phycisphaerales bacterium]|nr:ABC-type antimicrobial peptide transport system, permease component [Phycisphaerales bacterium]
MNLFQLILKQIRQRSLSTALTIFSIALGVGLAIAILVLQRESGNLFGQTDYGYEVLAGVKGSGLQLTVNTVYRIDRSPGNIKYGVYEKLMKDRIYRQDVRVAVPQCVGDSYKGRPIVGTTPQFFGYDDAGQRVESKEGEPTKRFEYRPGRSFEFAEGKPFREDHFEAVVGSDVPKMADLKLGDEFHATHGFPQPGQSPDVHEETWKVVGVLAPTHTAADKCVYIGLTSFYTIFEHAEAELAREATRDGKAQPAPAHEEDHDAKHYALATDGSIKLDKEVLDAREVSAILIKARGGLNAMNLIYNLNLQQDVMAVNPAGVMREFFGNFIAGPSMLLLVIAILVIVVASIGVLTTIYNAVSARTHEIAVLRALGATRNRILVMVTAEATLLGIVGGAIGFLLGHALAAGGSVVIEQKFGEGINWVGVSWPELACLVGAAVLAFFAGLVPALKAYSTPVATNLSGG